MGWEIEQAIDTYYGKYRNGLFGKQHSINLSIYPSHIEGNAFGFYEGKLSDDSYSFEISYESNAASFGERGERMFQGGGGMPGAGVPGGSARGGMPGAGMPPSGDFFGGPGRDNERMNQEKIVLSTDDMEDIAVFVPHISDVTISYTTSSEVEGGELEEAQAYTIAGVKENYGTMSNLSMAAGTFLTQENDENKEKYCVLGYSAAKEIFGSVYAAYDDVIYIDARPYVVSGVLEEMGSVSSGISPDTTVFIPYETGVKYITGTNISPTVTVIAADVNQVDTVIGNIETVLADSYANAEFTISDAGKNEAASKSNDTLQLLLIAMAVIVFLVGGIGIMNVLFVSVKERTNEIGILKALGCSKRDILLEFLFEACFMSFIGSVLGVLAAFSITPVIEAFRSEWSCLFWGRFCRWRLAWLRGRFSDFIPRIRQRR